MTNGRVYCIVEYEQNDSDRASYGAGLMRRLAHDLTLRVRMGTRTQTCITCASSILSHRKTRRLILISNHYLEILRADDPPEVAFYAKECENSKWSLREQHRQGQLMLPHRPNSRIRPIHFRDGGRFVARGNVLDVQGRQADALRETNGEVPRPRPAA